MMYLLSLLACLLLYIPCNANEGEANTRGKGGFYAFTVQNIKGEEVSLEEYRGKISLVVNVASECGYTDLHYEQLVKLYDELAIEEKKPFTVLGFPCNQFGQQEPYSNQHILDHVTRTYNVNFPMFAKLNVRDHDVHPAFQYLSKNSGSEPNWNFWKYLIDENGAVINAWGPRKEVNDIKDDIVEALAKLQTKHSEL